MKLRRVVELWIPITFARLDGTKHVKEGGWQGSAMLRASLGESLVTVWSLASRK